MIYCEAAAGGSSDLAGANHGGRDPPDRGERSDILSVAPGVWRVEDRAGEATKDLELENSNAASPISTSSGTISENSRLRKAVSDLTLDKHTRSTPIVFAVASFLPE